MTEQNACQYSPGFDQDTTQPYQHFPSVLDCPYCTIEILPLQEECMEQRYYLNRETGEVIDSHNESLCDFKRKNCIWDIFVISKKVYDKLKEERDGF